MGRAGACQFNNSQGVQRSRLDREIFLGASLLQERLQPARRQAAARPGFPIGAVVFGRNRTARGFGCGFASWFSASNRLLPFYTPGAAFHRLQVFGGNTKRFHFGANFFNSFVKFPALDVSRLFLQFLDLALDINKIIQDIFLSMKTNKKTTNQEDSEYLNKDGLDLKKQFTQNSSLSQHSLTHAQDKKTVH